jgi:hypothetical protein
LDAGLNTDDETTADGDCKNSPYAHLNTERELKQQQEQQPRRQLCKSCMMAESPFPACWSSKLHPPPSLQSAKAAPLQPLRPLSPLSLQLPGNSNRRFSLSFDSSNMSSNGGGGAGSTTTFASVDAKGALVANNGRRHYRISIGRNPRLLPSLFCDDDTADDADSIRGEKAQQQEQQLQPGLHHQHPHRHHRRDPSPLSGNQRRASTSTNTVISVRGKSSDNSHNPQQQQQHHHHLHHHHHGRNTSNSLSLATPRLGLHRLSNADSVTMNSAAARRLSLDTAVSDQESESHQ